MARNVGIFLDYSECVVSFPDEGEYIRRIASRAGRRIQLEADQASGGTVARDPHAAERLKKYYDEIISCVHSADAIIVFGPDAARTELHEAMLARGMGERVLAVEQVRKMSTSEIVTHVLESFEGATSGTTKTK